MNTKRYYIRTGLMALILPPLIVSVGLIIGMAINDESAVLAFVPSFLLVVLFWLLYSKIATMPDKISSALLPVFLVFCYYMCVWITVFGFSGYRFDSELFSSFFLLTLPYYLTNVIFAFVGDYSYFPIINAGITATAALTIVIVRTIDKKRLHFDKKAIILLGVFVSLCGVASFQHYDRSTKILSYDSQTERVDDEIDYHLYIPFSGEDGMNRQLKQLDEPPTVSFTEDYPLLDGATAAYPVYAAIVQELYKGLDENTVLDYIECSKTEAGYERLINSEIDIFFGAQPSKQQIEAAKAKGVELVLTPIAREAFVFFVNKDNAVNNLSVEQIQDIYQKKIVNWSAVGGKNERIMPFQRPENSGSQTIMLAKVMGGRPLSAPLLEEYSYGMGGIVSQVAKYRNYSSAIGYSFRYFATEMYPDDNIRLLYVDGIAPTSISIRNGTYPLSLDVYAVTAGPAAGNADILIRWILSEQGQDFIKTCGYVKLPVSSTLPEENPFEEERPDLTEWEQLISDWPMDFGFSDSTGARFIFQPGMPSEGLMESGFDPNKYSLLVGGRGEIEPVVFDAWQAAAEDEPVPYFDKQPGFVYLAPEKHLSKNKTYMLSSPGPLVDALIPLSRPSGEPYSITPMNTEAVDRIEALKNRRIDFCTVLAETDDGGQIDMVLFDRMGDELLFSIVYIDDEQVLFWDNPTEYVDYLDGGVWRVDTVGPGYFDVMFLARFDAGWMLMLNWGAFEGESVVLLCEKDGAFIELDRYLYSRYMPWLYD